MKQKIYADQDSFANWDQSKFSRCFIHLVNSTMWTEITGEQPPQTPIDAKTYTNMGYPWFDVWDENKQSVKSNNVIGNLKTVDELDVEKRKPNTNNHAFPIHNVITYNQPNKDPTLVSDGDW